MSGYEPDVSTPRFDPYTGVTPTKGWNPYPQYELLLDARLYVDENGHLVTGSLPDLTNLYVGFWKPNTVYTGGTLIINPSGQTVTAKTTFTTGAAYNPANWNLLAANLSGSDALAGVNEITTGAAGSRVIRADKLPDLSQVYASQPDLDANRTLIDGLRQELDEISVDGNNGIRTVKPESLPDLSDQFATPNQITAQVTAQVPPAVSSALTTELPKYVLKGANVINVKDAPYNAVGNGAADDAPAINAALKAASARGGATVLIPPGTYAIGSGLVIGSNTVIWAYGATLRRIAQISFMRSIDPADKTTTAYNGATNMAIFGGVWDSAANTFNPPTLANCFTFVHGQEALIQDATFLGVGGGHAIEFNGFRRGVVRNCRFFGFVDTGGRDFAECVQIDYCTDPIRGAADNTACESITVEGCITKSAPGYAAWPRLVGSHTGTATTWAKNIRVLNNRIQEVTSYGIRAQSWADVVIMGNVIESAGSYGIQVQGMLTDGNLTRCSNILISNNIIKNTGSTGINVESRADAYGVDNVSIIGNQISGTGVHGIATAFTSFLTISDNVIFDCGWSGVQAASGSSTRISGNHIASVKTNGVTIQSTTGFHLQNNLLSSINSGTTNGQGAIRISTSAARGTISGNTVIKSDGGAYAVAITGSCTDLWRFGNDFRGFGVDGISDASLKQATGSADLV